MIDTMQSLAKRVYPIRHLFVVMALLSLFAFIYVALSRDTSLDVYLFPSVVAFGWSVCLYGIIDVFQTTPGKVVAGDRFFTRLKKRIRRSIAWVWSVGFLLCTVLLFYLSYKSVSLALASL